MTTPNTTETPAVPTAPAPAVHASKLRSIFSELEKLIGLAADPAVMAFLPPKYQAYAGAALVIEQMVTSIAHPASEPAAS